MYVCMCVCVCCVQSRLAVAEETIRSVEKFSGPPMNGYAAQRGQPSPPRPRQEEKKGSFIKGLFGK